MNMIELPHSFANAAKEGDKKALEKLLGESHSLWGYKSAMQSLLLQDGGNYPAIRAMLDIKGLDKTTPEFSEMMHELFFMASTASSTKPKVIELLHPYAPQASADMLRAIFKEVAEAAVESLIPNPKSAHYLAQNGGDAKKAYDLAEKTLLAKQKEIAQKLSRLKKFKKEAGL